jgi:hypothetical protein
VRPRLARMNPSFKRLVTYETVKIFDLALVYLRGTLKAVVTIAMTSETSWKYLFKNRK